MKIPNKLKGLFFFIVNPRDLTITFSNNMQRGKKEETCTNHENFDFNKKAETKFVPLSNRLGFKRPKQIFYYFNTEEKARAFLQKLLCT